MADALGISKQSVGQFLDGRGTGKKHWAKIAALCKTTVEWIASGTGEQPTWAIAHPAPADVGAALLAELREHHRLEIERWDRIEKLLTALASGHPAAVGDSPRQVAG
jgi:hypothetical protein